jgi:hypothetical protein
MDRNLFHRSAPERVREFRPVNAFAMADTDSAMQVAALERDKLPTARKAPTAHSLVGPLSSVELPAPAPKVRYSTRESRYGSCRRVTVFSAHHDEKSQVNGAAAGREGPFFKMRRAGGGMTGMDARHSERKCVKKRP